MKLTVDQMPKKKKRLLNLRHSKRNQPKWGRGGKKKISGFKVTATKRKQQLHTHTHTHRKEINRASASYQTTSNCLMCTQMESSKEEEEKKIFEEISVENFLSQMKTIHGQI